ncbi:MAG: hypothetical protein AAB249_04355 [Acidobacteriota bacterium]
MTSYAKATIPTLAEVGTREVTNEDEFTATWIKSANAELTKFLRQWPLEAVASLTEVEAQGRRLAKAVVETFYEAWMTVLEEAALRIGRLCPGCSQPRKCKRRAEDPLEVQVVGLTLKLPKLYLYCEHCEAPGVSITRLLTDLSSGDASAELKLAAAYCAAEHSYGKASQDLEVHYGEAVERTKVRRLALDVEAEAKRFAEEERQRSLSRLQQERSPPGVECLMLQGDGGLVRTGTLVPCEQGDSGYRKKTAKRGRRRRKRLLQFREIITLDVREPGEVEATALDVVVPAVAKPNEREHRMLALAERKGLGKNTEVIGLGDLGSALPAAFEEAFHDYPGFYCGDWRHTSTYVQSAASVLENIDAAQWEQDMKRAIWNRRVQPRDDLLAKAHQHRMAALPAQFNKCPLAALDTYVHNNWEHLRARDLKRRGLDFVSARAEAQVRDRTKRRFAVPGAWLTEHLEGKALLRAIIADGRWSRFREHYLKTRATAFGAALRERLQQALCERRIAALPTDRLAETHNEEDQRSAA